MKHGLLFLILFSALSASAKQGLYLEFKMSSRSVSGSSATYVVGGDTRVETEMKNPAMQMPVKMVMLMLHDSPDVTYNLNEKDKTYTTMNMSRANENDEDYEITLIGSETVNGYHCAHVSVLYKKTNRSSDWWISKEVKGYADFVGVKTKYLHGSRFFNDLKAKGADGFVVRMMVNGDRGDKMQMDLVKAEKRDISESLFSLSGYTKTTLPATPGFDAPDMQKLQSMTPEERKRYIEEMRQRRYSRPEH